MSSRTLSLIGIFVIATLVGAAAPAQAQGYFGLYGGLYQPDEEDDGDLDRTESFGVRAGYRFQNNFGFEGSLSRVDLADSIPNEDDPFFDFDFQLDLYNLDLSLQWFPKGGNFVVFGGPGVSRLDAEVSATIFGERFSESDTENILTAHLGLGYDWQVNDRFFIRPEARVRRYFDDEIDEGDVEDDGLGISYEATDYEAGVTFGWRF